MPASIHLRARPESSLTEERRYGVFRWSPGGDWQATRNVQRLKCSPKTDRIPAWSTVWKKQKTTDREKSRKLNTSVIHERQSGTDQHTVFGCLEKRIKFTEQTTWQKLEKTREKNTQNLTRNVVNKHVKVPKIHAFLLADPCKHVFWDADLKFITAYTDRENSWVK